MVIGNVTQLPGVISLTLYLLSALTTVLYPAGSMKAEESAGPLGPHSTGSIFPVQGQIQTMIRVESKPQFSKSGKISLLL